MQHKFKNAELKNVKVVYKYLLIIILLAYFIMSFDIAKTIEQELAKIKGTSDTNSRLGQMENLIMKLKEHLQKTEKINTATTIYLLILMMLDEIKLLIT